MVFPFVSPARQNCSARGNAERHPELLPLVVLPRIGAGVRQVLAMLVFDRKDHREACRTGLEQHGLCSHPHARLARPDGLAYTAVEPVIDRDALPLYGDRVFTAALRFPMPSHGIVYTSSNPPLDSRFPARRKCQPGGLIEMLSVSTDRSSRIC